MKNLNAPSANARFRKAVGLAGALGAAAALVVGLTSCSVSSPRTERIPGASVLDSAEMPARVFYEAAIRGMAVGMVKNPVTTTRKGIHAVQKRTLEVLPPLRLPDATTDGRPGGAAFEAMLDREGVGIPSSGKLTALVDGRSYFNRLHRAIDEARESIDWRLFIFDNDDYAVGLADRLKRRSREVQTRVLYDRLGTYLASKAHPRTPYPDGFVPPASIADHLESGSRVRVRPRGNPWLIADHSKVLMFDRQIAFVGGMNVGREYRSEWHDLMVELRGPVVGVLADDFDREWRLAGPAGDFSLLGSRDRETRVSSSPGDFPIRVLRTEPHVYEIERAHLAAIDAARDSIVIVTPYFSCDFVAAALVEAARRGVRVDVILPGKNNSKIMEISNWDTARRLMEGGVRVSHYPGASHLKAARCDSWVCLGSANLDTLSMRLNQERNIAFSHPAKVEILNREVFRKDLAKSRRLRTRDLKGKGSPLAEMVADQL